MSVFPFMTGGSATSSANALPIFREYAWDFEHDCFIYRDGKHVIVEGKEALKVWIYKTLKTERYRHPIYSRSYGVELEQYQGKRTNNDETEMEVERYVTEALLVNPYIRRVVSIDHTCEKDVLSMDITLDTEYGEVIMSG